MLKRVKDILQEKPRITDEELASLLGVRRSASARFWRLKASDLLVNQ